jgi:hypothetical protein
LYGRERLNSSRRALFFMVGANLQLAIQVAQAQALLAPIVR